MKIKRILSILFILMLTLTGCGSKSNTVNAPVSATHSASAAQTVPETATEPVTEPDIEPVTINLVSVGDMLMHASASNPALQPDGSYNYDYLFEHVKSEISSADIAISNNEVIMGGNEKGNIGYPTFNVRTELGDAQVKAGFDVFLCATNHTMDQGVNGVFNCLDYWKTSHPEAAIIGAYQTKEEQDNIYVKDVNGIKIALLNYTYGTNGISVPAKHPYAVNLMNENTRPEIADDIQRAKELADFVIVFPHWGIEYNLSVTSEQEQWAQWFADMGVDLIIGTHPHVVEPVKWIEGSSGNKTLVYYSLGNFVSVQYYNYSMLGGMAKVSITKDSNGTYISSADLDFLVTHYTSGRSVITTYFLDDYTDDLAKQHAILFEPSDKYMAVNASYPFTVAGLKALAKSICPDMASDY